MKVKTFVRKSPIEAMLMTLLALALVMAMAANVHASTASNTTIRNTVTVNYADAAGNPQTPLTANVDITVNLVESTPLLNAPPDQSIDASQTAVYNYLITSTANGPDTYNLNVSSIVESAGINGSTATLSVTTIDLGASTAAATVTIAATGNTDITVPSDNASDGQVNGIAAGDTVVIGGAAFTVASVVDNGGVGTSTITVTGNGTATSVNSGDLISEQGSFTLTVTPGTVTDATNNQTITVDITAQADGGSTAAATDQTVTTVTAVQLTITKYVRNVTNPNGSGTSVNVDGNTYYAANVTGVPGDTMEYLVAVANGAGSPATNVIIQDSVPAFTTYVAGSMALDPGSGTFGGLNDNDNGGDAGEYDGTNQIIYIYAGSGGNDGAAGYGNGTGGNLPVNTTTYGRFRVTID